MINIKYFKITGCDLVGNVLEPVYYAGYDQKSVMEDAISNAYPSTMTEAKEVFLVDIPRGTIIRKHPHIFVANRDDSSFIDKLTGDHPCR
jgi:hypothetical protein